MGEGWDGASLLVGVPRGAGRRAPHTCSAWRTAQAFPEAPVARSQAQAGPRGREVGTWRRLKREEPLTREEPRAQATPREVLETPAAARVQVSAGLQACPRHLAWVPAAGRSVLPCAELEAGSRVKQPCAPRPAPRSQFPFSATAWVPVPPAFIPRVRAVRSAAPFLPVWLNPAGPDTWRAGGIRLLGRCGLTPGSPQI